MNFTELHISELWQWASIGASLIAFAGYEFYLRKTGSTAPMKTARSAHATIRRQWIKSVMGRPGAEILVIQTLRNSVMAGSFMASTAVLALSGTLTLSGAGKLTASNAFTVNPGATLSLDNSGTLTNTRILATAPIGRQSDEDLIVAIGRHHDRQRDHHRDHRSRLASGADQNPRQEI